MVGMRLQVPELGSRPWPGGWEAEVAGCDREEGHRLQYCCGLFWVQPNVCVCACTPACGHTHAHICVHRE